MEEFALPTPMISQMKQQMHFREFHGYAVVSSQDIEIAYLEMKQHRRSRLEDLTQASFRAYHFNRRRKHGVTGNRRKTPGAADK